MQQECVPSNKIPLCVRLDDTLMATNLFWEAIVAILINNFLLLFLFPIWFFKGNIYLNQKILEHLNISADNTKNNSKNKFNVRLFPYRKRLVDFIKSQKDAGRETILITNSDIKTAELVYRYLGIFNHIIALEENILSYADIKNILINNFGEKGFDYIGHSEEDLQIFEVARLSYLVEPSNLFYIQAKKVANIETVFKSKKDKIYIFFQTIHIKRILLHLLLFLPVFCTWNLLDESIKIIAICNINTFSNCFFAFLTLSFIGFSTSIFNNVFDINLDRQHPLKRHRTLAIGKFSIKNAVILQHIFLLIGLAIPIIFIPQILFLVIIISILSYSYSILFKPIPILNIIILVAVLFCEIIIGILLLDVNILQVINIQNLILFLSIALSIVCWKQYYEFNKLKAIKQAHKSISNYSISHKNIFLIIGIVFTFIFVAKIIVSIIY